MQQLIFTCICLLCSPVKYAPSHYVYNSDGIDAVRGCVEEMKGQLPLDGAASSSRMVSLLKYNIRSF